MENFFGGTPMMVLLRLALISLVVGIIMAALNLDALELIQHIKHLFRQVYNLGWGAIEWVLQYFMLGAVIVFPIWLIARLVKTMGNSGGNSGGKSGGSSGGSSGKN